MKTMIKRVVIIILNSILVVITFIQLYNDFKEQGKFQWVDQSRIEDHEELYFTPIFVTIVGFGLIVILYNILKPKNKSLNKGIKDIIIGILRYLYIIYSIFLVTVSSIFLIMLIGNAGNHSNERGFFFSFFIFILILIAIFSFGVLMIYDEIRKKNSS
jgi:hypothetical protein